MESSHIRIFLTSSHICTVYTTMYAKATRRENDIDILIIDAGKRRQGLIDLITQTAQLHRWDLFHDFSLPQGEDLDYAPTTRKAITRKIKTWPIIRNVYELLLKRHMNEMDERYRNELKRILEPFLKYEPSISLFRLTQTYLNRPIQQLFPQAEINFLEHGIGDYYYVLDEKILNGNLYCVFSEPYKRFLAKKGKSTDWIKPLPGISDFPKMAKQLIGIHRESMQLEKMVTLEKSCVFVLLEAVDMYQVSSSFWAAYLDNIFAQLEHPEQFHYLLKPHPMQSEESLFATKNHMNELGYSYTLLNHPGLINASAEVLFSLWAQNTQHVFCLFSSGCFYLSKLYASENIKFWYSTEFMSNHISNAPPQFRKAFMESRILIEEVFSENCHAY